MKISVVLATMLLLPAVALAQAPTGIELENPAFNGEQAVGTCGPARIEIEGVDRDNPHDTKHLIPGFQSKVTIQSSGKSLVLGDGGDPTISLENFAKLHCVATPAGPRLVLAAHCTSTYCLPINFTVIEPASLRILGKGDDMGCNQQCARQALGRELPETLTAPLNGSYTR